MNSSELVPCTAKDFIGKDFDLEKHGIVDLRNMFCPESDALGKDFKI